jgi:hypothetical protein
MQVWKKVIQNFENPIHAKQLKHQHRHAGVAENLTHQSIKLQTHPDNGNNIEKINQIFIYCVNL